MDVEWKPCPWLVSVDTFPHDKHYWAWWGDTHPYPRQPWACAGQALDGSLAAPREMPKHGAEVDLFYAPKEAE